MIDGERTTAVKSQKRTSSNWMGTRLIIVKILTAYVLISVYNKFYGGIMLSDKRNHSETSDCICVKQGYNQL